MPQLSLSSIFSGVMRGVTRAYLFTKKYYAQIVAYIRTHTSLQFVLVAAFFFSLFFIVYFSIGTVSSTDDHFFHFRFAEQMVHNGFFDSFRDFKSIYFSKMAQGNEYFVYYNFLFYLIILPFSFITPLFLGIKLYAVCAVAAAFTLLFYCLKKFDIRNPFVWSLIFIAITNTSSILRFFLSRPYALAPSLLLLLLMFLYRKNHAGVFVVCFLYLYWHSATFFLPVCVAIGYFIIEKFYRTKADYKNLLMAIAGTAAALLLAYVISPGFLSYIKEIIFGTYVETIIGKKVPIAEGGELYPIDFFNFIQGNALIFSAFVTMLAVDIFNYVALKFKKISTSDYLVSLSQDRKTVQTTVLILTALFFLGTVAVSARFGDYFTMFAALYIALSIDYIRRTITVMGPLIMKRGIAVGFGIVLVYLLTSNMLFLQQRIARGSGIYDFYQIGNWLAQHSAPGEVVFEANWSWFPQLYYYSPKNNYSMGLEPRFMYTYNPKIYWLSAHISVDGYVCDQQECPDINKAAIKAYHGTTTAEVWAKEEGDKIADTLTEIFKSKYVVSSKEYLGLNFIMSHNKRFEKKIYDAPYGLWLYEVKPPETKK